MNSKDLNQDLQAKSISRKNPYIYSDAVQKLLVSPRKKSTEDVCGLKFRRLLSAFTEIILSEASGRIHKKMKTILGFREERR